MANSSAVLFGVADLFAVPFNANNTFPLATSPAGDFGKTWGKVSPQSGDWTGVGYTQEGLTFNMSTERGEIVADQVLDPLFRPITGRSVSISGNLIEFTAGNLKLAMGQGAASTTAPSSGVRGYDEYALTANFIDSYHTWGIDAEKPSNGQPFRILLWKGLATSALQSAVGQRDTAARIPLEITALPDDSATPARILTIRDYTAPGT